ncbi:unnamed protein product [Amoebophrya sp. A120]|nr:unnamed protein product [Amoebophrya sp. A120]|eukprot:GSA120T00017479001.1
MTVDARSPTLLSDHSPPRVPSAPLSASGNPAVARMATSEAASTIGTDATTMAAASQHAGDDGNAMNLSDEDEEREFGDTPGDLPAFKNTSLKRGRIKKPKVASNLFPGTAASSSSTTRPPGPIGDGVSVGASSPSSGPSASALSNGATPAGAEPFDVVKEFYKNKNQLAYTSQTLSSIVNNPNRVSSNPWKRTEIQVKDVLRGVTSKKGFERLVEMGQSGFEIPNQPRRPGQLLERRTVQAPAVEVQQPPPRVFFCNK